MAMEIMNVGTKDKFDFWKLMDIVITYKNICNFEQQILNKDIRFVYFLFYNTTSFYASKSNFSYTNSFLVHRDCHINDWALTFNTCTTKKIENEGVPFPFGTSFCKALTSRYIIFVICITTKRYLTYVHPRQLYMGISEFMVISFMIFNGD